MHPGQRADASAWATAEASRYGLMLRGSWSVVNVAVEAPRRRPFDWARDCGRQYPPIVGYGRGRPLFDDPTERQLRAEGVLRHRRRIVEVNYTPAEHFAVASLTCGHSVRLPDAPRCLRAVGRLMPCPECAA